MRTLKEKGAVIRDESPIYRGYYSSIIQYIDVRDLKTSKNQSVGRETVNTFSESIKKNGFLRPLFINTEMEIVDGRKRISAALSLGLSHVPCIYSPSPLVFEDDFLILKLLNDPVNFFDYAQILFTLTNTYLYSQESIAFSLGRSQSFIANKLRLLRLTEEEQKIIRENELTERHCRALLQIGDPEMRRDALKHITSASLNVSASEEYIYQLINRSRLPKADLFHSELKALISKYSESFLSLKLDSVCDKSGIIYSIRILK